MLDREARDQRKIAARRARNEARRIKFLTAKTRLIGQDMEAIDAQKAEKIARKEAERAAEDAYMREQKMIRDLVEENLAKEQHEDYMNRRMCAEIQLQSKDPSTRREWHLNDPRALAKEKPTTGDRLEAEGALGASSMMGFQGEDRNYGDRRKLMQAQLREWTAQQLSEYVTFPHPFPRKLLIAHYTPHLFRSSQFIPFPIFTFTFRKEQRRLARKAVSDMEAMRIRQIVDITGEIEAKEAAEKYEEALMYAEANKQLAQDAADRRARERNAQKAASLNHVANQRSSQWLTEDPSAGLRRGGVRRDQWKGMSTSQLQAHYDAQYEQMLEKQARKQRDAMNDAEFAENQRMIQDAMQQVVMKQQQEHQAMERNIRLHQAEQAVRARERKVSEKHTGAVTEEFFNYFGSSCR